VPAGRLDEPQQRLGKCGLPAARLPDQAEGLSRSKVEAHPIDRPQECCAAAPAPGVIDDVVLGEVLDTKQWLVRH
jgi:hypothetical protein